LIDRWPGSSSSVTTTVRQGSLTCDMTSKQ
jgi:hypothetical protein